MIQFIENKDKNLIPFIGSKSLCSFKRPLSEAMAWLKSYNLKGQTDVCILGAGGGYHIKYLSLRYPSVNIRVYGFNYEAIELLEEKFKNQGKIKLYHIDSLTGLSSLQDLQSFIVEKMPVIMPFRPSWQNNEEKYSNLLIKITQREVSVLKSNWHSMNVDINFSCNHLEEEKNFLTLKNLLQASDSLSTFDEKVLHLFDEIIR
ncbi:MAG: hypothetical protein KDD45_02910 [Bdellovibrionales bacterium]|nr:hypothetical protein [Bdellovibrionales bacterium]